MTKRRKYTKGWLCREWDGLVFCYPDEPEQVANGSWVNEQETSVSGKTWFRGRFKKDYDTNFDLPAPGEKVFCEVEL